MTTTEKLRIIASAFTTKKVEDAREEITIINDKLEKWEQEEVSSLLYKFQDHIGSGSRELSYEIMDKACDIIIELSNDHELDADNEMGTDEAIRERTEGGANVYTSVRLSWLNQWNQQEISDMMEEYGCDNIADACAYWYDQQLNEACQIINEWVKED